MEALERDVAGDSGGDSDATHILEIGSERESDSSFEARANAVPLAVSNPVLAALRVPVVDLANGDDSESEAEFEIAPPAPLARNDDANADSDGADSDDVPLAASAPTRKRKRLRRGDDVVKPEKPPEKLEKPTVVFKPEPTECSVCYDPCTISGRHRLVSLKCGHVFGKKCIDRWVLERKTCPNCSVAVRKADIRPLFTDHVAVVDNSGLENMTQKFEAEKSRRLQIETELSRAKLQLQLAQSEAKRFQDEAERWRKQVTELQCRAASERFTAGTPMPLATASATAASPSQGGFERSVLSQPSTPPVPMPPRAVPPAAPFSQGGGGFLTQPSIATPPRPAPPTYASQPTPAYASQPTTVSMPATSSSLTSTATRPAYRELFQYPLQSSRVFAISSSCSIVCVGEAFAPTSHGILKVSTANSRHAVRIAAHTSAIRDLSISPQDDLALSVAWDGKAVISSLRSDSVVLQLSLPPNRRNAWSCSFSQVDPFVYFCGFQDGTIAQYDMRRQAMTGDSVVALYELPVRQPVHSIQVCPVMGGGHEQLVGGTFAGFGVWGSEKLRHPPVSGTSTAVSSFHRALNCCGVSSSQTKRSHLVVTTRSQPPAVSAKHTIFQLPTVMTGSNEPVMRSSIEGFRTPQAMSRAAVWEASDGNTMVASWDDEHKRVSVWDESTQQVKAHLSRPSSGGPSVVDVQHSIADGNWRRHSALLGVLSPQRLVMYAGSG